VQICGALDAAVAATVRHTTDRVQFGRSLSQFQAVQHRLADAAAEAALARAATWAALDEAVSTDFAGPGLDVSIAVARSCAGHAGSVVVGTTREHSLHQLPVPILAWTNEFGTVAEFDEFLTRAAIASEVAGGQGAAGGVWALLSDPPH
jgi:acyl-CoA dehydrogenase